MIAIQIETIYINDGDSVTPGLYKWKNDNDLLLQYRIPFYLKHP